MKKLLAVLIGLLLLAGCGSPSAAPNGTTPSDPPAASAEPESPATEQPAEEAPEEAPGELAVDSTYAVTIDGSRVSKTYDGKPALIVDFTFTNNSDEAANFMFATRVQAFQDGIELGSAFISDDKKYDPDSAMKDIKPGKSLKVQSAFELADKKTDVEIEVTELISFDDTVLASAVLKIKK